MERNSGCKSMECIKVMLVVEIRGFCSNLGHLAHAQILHTVGFKGEEFNEGSLDCRKLTILEIFEFKVTELP
jgi:hypothetical protein